MEPGIPWSVKGIEPETREAAKDAARRSGMSLGEWLNTKILDSSDGVEQDLAPTAPPFRHRASRDDTSIRLEDIAEQLSRIARGEQSTAPAQSMYSSESNSEDAEALRNILDRVESSERHNAEIFASIHEQLAALGRQLAQPLSGPRHEDVSAIRALEAAVRNTVEHIEISEARTRDALKSMQERMADMAGRAMASANEQVLQSAPAFSQLEQRLNELSDRTERSQSRADFPLPDAIHGELKELSERIETVRDSAQHLATRAQASAVENFQEELREFEKKILGLINDAQFASMRNTGADAKVEKLHEEIEVLSQLVAGSHFEVASKSEIYALQAAVEQLTTGLAKVPDLPPFVEMDYRLTEIMNLLEESHAAQSSQPQFGELENRMAELDSRLENAMRQQGDAGAQQALEQKISEVSERVGRTEHQLSNLETIERAINQLFESVEQSRNSATEIAEDAANRMADRLMNGPNAVAAQPGSSPELQALQDGLNAVREAADGADRRNQETLEAVHETLEQIVTKLAELEITAQVHQDELATVNQLRNAAPAAAPPVKPAAAWPQLSGPVAEAALQNHVFAEAPAEVFEEAVVAETADPDSAWIENSKLPATGTISSSELKSALAPEDDFIAAARLASQAASQGITSVFSPQPGPAARRPEIKAAMPAPSKAPAGNRAPPKIMPDVSGKSGKRRALLLAGIVVLAAVAAFTAHMMYSKPKAKTTMAPAAASGFVVANTVASPKAMVQHNRVPDGAKDEILTGSLPDHEIPAPAKAISAASTSSSSTSEIRDGGAGFETQAIAAKGGDTSAQFVLATRYLDGDGVTKDASKAAYWYHKAALAGSAPAQYRLATQFERGLGVPKNTATALAWYIHAAELGNVKAMHNAAVISAGSEAGKPNYEIAYKWFHAAAAAGLKDSQFNLAVLYERGLGTKADLNEALFWYIVAASQKDADAQKRVGILLKDRAPASVAAVQARAKSWIPVQAPASANTVTVSSIASQRKTVLMQVVPTQPKIDSRIFTQDPISLVQELLKKLGFNVGSVDGKLNPRTSNAIRLFQLQSGTQVTGEVSDDLISRLQARLG